MTQHEYRAVSSTKVEDTLRSVERLEREGWELVTIHYAGIGYGSWTGYRRETMAIVRRPSPRTA